VGEIAQGSGLVAKVVRELGIPNPARAIPADLVDTVTRLLGEAVSQFRGSLGSSDSKRREAWIPPFVSIFRLLASRRLQEEHADIKSFRTAVRNDLQTTRLLSERGFNIASMRVPSSWWDQPLYELLSQYANQYAIEWLERAERLRSVVMSDPKEMFGDPLPLCKPRDPRAKDTFTARRIEQFRRRMEAGGMGKVGLADMVDYLGYKGPSMLQRVSREANASHGAKENVERMLKCPSPEEFWHVVNKRRSSKARPQ
jgi:hypothetical protein